MTMALVVDVDPRNEHTPGPYREGVAVRRVGEILSGAVQSWPDSWTELDARDIVTAAAGHSVAPLLARCLSARGDDGAWPQWVREELRQQLREAAMRECLAERELRRIVVSLAAAAVPSLLMKGAALAYTVYPDSSLRPRLDQDLLARRQDAEPIERTLTNLGYRRQNYLTGEVANQQALFIREDPDARGLRHALDVHWKISNRPTFGDLLMFDELLERAVAVPALGWGARAPSSVDALLLACIHRVAHHENSPLLIWLYDIHLLAGGLSTEEWNRFVALADERRVRAICANGLALAEERFQTVVPADVRLRLSRSDDEPSAVFLTAKPWRGDIRLSDVATMPGWRQRLRLVREVVFPDRSYMFAAYGRANLVLLPLLYVHRLARGTWRLLWRFAG